MPSTSPRSPAANGFADVAEVGCPAGVLIDGQFDVVLVGQIGEPLADVEIDDERFLAQHVFAGPERSLDERRPDDGVRGDVDHFDVVAPKHLLEDRR